MSDGPSAAGKPTIEGNASDMPTSRELKDLQSQIHQLREELARQLEQNKKERDEY
jgi:hypothetical protein